MSSALGTSDEIADQLRRRLDGGLRRIAFFIVPSAMAMLALGDVMTRALYQTGQFKHADSRYVWGILAGSTIVCWLRRSDAFTHQPTMRCMTRALRSATRLSE